MPLVFRWFISHLILFVPLVLVIHQVNGWYPNSDDWPWWVAALLLGTLIAAGYAAWRFWVVMDPYLRDYGKSTEQIIAELEGKGLIRRDVFHARRAFQMEELEDEGSNFFVELEDGHVLFISGQILYGYEPVPEEPDVPRQFPSTEFEVVHRTDTGDLLDLICRGQPLEPEALAPAFTLADFQTGWTPENLELIDRSYDELKAERLRA